VVVLRASHRKVTQEWTTLQVTGWGLLTAWGHQQTVICGLRCRIIRWCRVLFGVVILPGDVVLIVVRLIVIGDLIISHNHAFIITVCRISVSIFRELAAWLVGIPISPFL
jgi:hypothetical protein